MSSKKELNVNELEKVSGGANGTSDPKINGFSGFVNMYDLTTGNEYYFVDPNNYTLKWCRGRVLDSWEKSDGCNRTRRTHKVSVTQVGTWDDCAVGSVVEVDGAVNCVYTTKNNN